MASLADVEHQIPGDYQIDAILRGWRFQRAWHRARLDLLSCVLPLPAAGLVLDAAAGSGLVAWHLNDRRIVSVDMRFAACVALRSHTPDAAGAVGTLEALPFGAGVFEQAYLLEVIEHLSGQQGVRALSELHRVCRSGARCLVTTPNYLSHWPIMERAIDLMGLAPPMEGGQHITQYSAETLRAAVQASGWKALHQGSFNLVAPLLGIFSTRLGRWATRLEAARLRRGGALLFAVCERQ
jgi:SAM-dependent methyltransferase